METNDPLFGAAFGTPEYRERHLSHPDPAVRERRRRVLDRYPNLGVDVLFGEVIRLVDAGKPWEDAFLSRVAGMAGVRKVPRTILTMCAGKRFPGGGIVNLAEIAARIPERWLPDPGSADADAFLEVCAAISPLITPGLEDEIQSLFENCGGRWVKWRDRLLSSVSLSITETGEEDELLHEPDYHPRRPTLSEGVEKASEVAAGFANQIVIPILVRDLGMAFHEALEVGYDAAMCVFLQGAPLEEFLGLTRYFEEDESSTFDSALYERLPESELPEYDALIALTDLGEGIQATPLTSVHALIDEMRVGMNLDGSFGLGIGVGGCIQRCMHGNAYPLSLRDNRGNRRGAVLASYDYDVLPERARFKFERNEARIRTEWPGIVIRADVAGPGGAPLDEAALRAFKRLAVGISEGRVTLLTVPPEEMIESGRKLVGSMDGNDPAMLAEPPFTEREGIDALAEYPVAARGSVEAAFEAWKPYLPRYLGAGSFEQLKCVVEVAAKDMDMSRATMSHPPQPAP